ncbi:uncharacterized protein LOC141655264 [Silene latifolia]|uniref:uncharacterized protein LOC141655264 n=1 Tax=Silene latifolia TaxID=37657 RepID=UPI003D775DEB
MAYITNTHEFKFHPLCKPLKLTHMMFADDLLLFSKGDSYSMMTVLRTFATFSKASGLNLSKGKSNAYFNGVPDSLKAEIMQVSGLVEGTLPFRYLGVPIKTTRLTAHDCKPHIDKGYNREFIAIVGEWLRLDIPADGLLDWRVSRGGTRDDKEIINVVLNACIYKIWQQ